VTIWPGSCYDNDIGSSPTIVRQRKNNMKMNALVDLQRNGPGPDDGLPTLELLARVPLDQLDDAVRTLKVSRSAEEIRAAVVDRIARAPLTEFQILKAIYLTHCAD
jgi:hypothetical protein